MPTPDTNPHNARILSEHNYARGCVTRTQTPKRSGLPSWMLALQDEPVAAHSDLKKTPDGVYNYASAVLMMA